MSKQELQRAYDLLLQNPMKLDLTRGKPAPEQLALSDALDGILAGNYRASDGTDTRNYGGYLGIPEARELGAELLDVAPDEVLVAGNASLTLQHQGVELCLKPDGLWGDGRSWARSEKPTALCPVPGYDRHFTINDSLGIAMEPVALTGAGPAMDDVEQRVAADANLKSLWCVPKFSNPTGESYDDATVERIARLPAVAAADDFIVFWDNAYAVHDFVFPGLPIKPLLAAAKAAGTAEHMLLFASTSKITFAGAGVGFLGAVPSVLKRFTAYQGTFTVGHDKVNQLRHARFLNGRLTDHMAQHAALIKPKFDVLQKVLDAELGGRQVATWTRPAGGYFVSLDCVPGTASRVVTLAAAVGLQLTAAGATHPYKHDPEDKTIRIAPTYASLEDVETAAEVLCLCIRLAAAEQAA